MRNSKLQSKHGIYVFDRTGRRCCAVKSIGIAFKETCILKYVEIAKIKRLCRIGVKRTETIGHGRNIAGLRFKSLNEGKNY